MKKNLKTRFLLILMATSAVLPVAGQKAVVLIPSESKIIINGTSNLHEWEEKVERFEVSLQLQPKGTGIGSISNVSFSSKTASVVSENSIMTGKTHDALQVEKHPEIIFRSSESSTLDFQGTGLKGTIVGDINLNGVTKQITIPYTAVLNGDKLEISGTEELNMSDYNIKPPTALMGTLKTGNKVTITFSLRFKIV